MKNLRLIEIDQSELNSFLSGDRIDVNAPIDWSVKFGDRIPWRCGRVSGFARVCMVKEAPSFHVTTIKACLRITAA